MPRTLLAFTENYRKGGGVRYLVDFVNAAGGRFDSLVIASNPGALSAADLAAIERPAELVEARFATAARVTARGGPLASLGASIVRAADPLVFGMNVERLERLVRARCARVVVCFNGGYPAARSNLAMMVAARRAGARAFLSVVGTPVPRRARLEGYEARLDARVWGAAEAILVNARSVAADLESMRGAPRGKLRLVRNGLADDAPVRPPEALAPEPVIGCVSRVDAEKGALDLLESFAAIASEFPLARLRLVGEGNARRSVLDRARALGLGARVEVPGPIAGDVARIVAEFDIYAFASHHEGFPYAILEAMRAGCPIVTTGVGGVPEAVRNGVDGLIVAPRRPGDLAAALSRMLRDPDLRSACARSARARFTAEFSLAAMNESVQRLFDEPAGPCHALDWRFDPSGRTVEESSG